MVKIRKEEPRSVSHLITPPWSVIFLACEQWLRIRKSRMLKNVTGSERKEGKELIKYLKQSDPNFTAFLKAHPELEVLLDEEE